jgi:hypothetical protein
MEPEKRTGSIAASGHVHVDQDLSGQDDADMLGKSLARMRERIQADRL